MFRFEKVAGGYRVHHMGVAVGIVTRASHDRRYPWRAMGGRFETRDNAAGALAERAERDDENRVAMLVAGVVVPDGWAVRGASGGRFQVWYGRTCRLGSPHARVVDAVAAAFKLAEQYK